MNFLPSIFAIFVISIGALTAESIPDTTTNRHATAEDASWWYNANEGDYLIFQPTSGNSVYHSATVRPITLGLGKKFLIYQRNYQRIYLDGTFCENTKETPTIVTNFGGQVRWGASENATQYRTFHLVNFDHVHFTGRYDPAAQTGHPDFRGHDSGQAMDSGNYYEKYGMWGYPKWSGPRHPFENGGVSYGNIVRASDYQSLKIDYVAAWGGGFASFNLKTDNPTTPKTVNVDVQDTFSGFGEGEGMYISYSTAASGQDATRLTLKNNIVMFPGGDGFQTDNLAPGSVIENNVVVGSGRFFRRPFQGRFHDNAHQLSWLAGDVIVRNNIYYGAVGYLTSPRFRATEEGRFTPDADKPIILENNYLGHGEDNIGWIPQGNSVTAMQFINNVFGPISTPTTDDSKSDPIPIDGFIQFNNSNTPITLRDNITPEGSQFYFFSNGTGENLVENSGNRQLTPQEVVFQDLGFDDDFKIEDVSFYTATYEHTPDGIKDGQPVPYPAGEIVITYDASGETLLYRCREAHLATGFNGPLQNDELWEHLTWNRRNLPPFDVRIQPDTFYNYRNMGLTYNEASVGIPDIEPPVISITEPVVIFGKGSLFVEPGVSAIDAIQGDLSANIIASWVGPIFDGNTPGNYLLRYDVSDAIGNKAAPIFREARVYDQDVVILRDLKINMHRHRPAGKRVRDSRNDSTGLIDWTDVANSYAGLISDADTITEVYDDQGQSTNISLRIKDINGGYSEHAKDHSNPSGIQIGPFPSSVTIEGILIRDPSEKKCVFEFTGLNPDLIYDVLFTGYHASVTTPLNVTLTDAESGASAALDVSALNLEVRILDNLIANNHGSLDLEFTTTTPNGHPSISGLILREKSGIGEPDVALQPSDFLVEVNPELIPVTQPLPISEPLFQLPESAADTLTVTCISSDEIRLPSERVIVTIEKNSAENWAPRIAVNTNGLAPGTTPMTFLVKNETASFFAKEIPVIIPSDFTIWVTTSGYFGPDGGNPDMEESVWGRHANPDGDLLPNWLERLFGTNPMVADDPTLPHGMIFDLEENSLTVTITSGLPEGVFDMEISSDLKNWKSCLQDMTSSSENGDTQIRYSLPLDQIESNCALFRLKYRG